MLPSQAESAPYFLPRPLTLPNLFLLSLDFDVVNKEINCFGLLEGHLFPLFFHLTQFLSEHSPAYSGKSAFYPRFYMADNPTS